MSETGNQSAGFTPERSNHHQLQCMELWNGNRSIENIVQVPGFEAWIFSEPYHGASRGGDVHYLSLCVGGIIARVVLADVAGHGDAVADTSKTLRQLLRRFMNAKSQDRLVVDLNRRFTKLEKDGRFATAVVVTYLSHKGRLLLTNAGHPRPLLYRQSVGRWQYLNDENFGERSADNLPLGLDDQSSYQRFELSIEPGDWLLLYTDAFTEAANADGKMLGEAGWKGLVEQISLDTRFEEFGRQVMRSVAECTEGVPPDDDATLIAIRFSKNRRFPGIKERLQGYGSLFSSLFE